MLTKIRHLAVALTIVAATTTWASPAQLAPASAMPVTQEPVSYNYVTGERIDPSELSHSAQRQHGTLHLPASVDPHKPLPVVVFIHGGGWMQKSTAEQATPHVKDLVRRGVAVWNIDYRGITKDGSPAPGGWPKTYEDVAAAIDFLPTVAHRSPVPLDLSNVVVAGYSAGGNLATWACSRGTLPAGSVGSHLHQRVNRCVGIAGVYDMALAHTQHDEYVDTLLGGTPTSVPDRYTNASPADHIDPTAHVTVLHGKNDEIVNSDQAVTYTDRALAAGQDVTEVLFDDATHLSWTHLDSPQWHEARKHILLQLGLVV